MLGSLLVRISQKDTLPGHHRGDRCQPVPVPMPHCPLLAILGARGDNELRYKSPRTCMASAAATHTDSCLLNPKS